MKKSVLSAVVTATVMSVIATQAVANDTSYGASSKSKFSMHTSAKVMSSIKSSLQTKAPPIAVVVKTNYDDLRARCDDSMNDLLWARSQAVSMKTFAGDVDRAAAFLLERITTKAAGFSSIVSGATAVPHTAIMTVEAAKLAQSFFALVDQSQVKLVGASKSGIKYNFALKLIDVITQAHNELDQDFYEVINKCGYYGCYTQVYENQAYNIKVASIVKKLIDVYYFAEESMATDVTNLSMAIQFAQSSADLLSQSPFRMNYARSIITLADAAAGAQASLARGNAREIANAITNIDYYISSTMNHVHNYKVVIVQDDEQDYGSRSDSQEDRGGWNNR